MRIKDMPMQEVWDQRTGCATTVKPLQHYCLTFAVMSPHHVPARSLRADFSWPLHTGLYREILPRQHQAHGCNGSRRLSTALAPRSALSS